MQTMDWAIAMSKIKSRSTGFPPLAGYAFEDKSGIWPLQAADIYAWTSFQQMQKLISNRKLSWVAELAFELLQERGLLNWGYFDSSNLPSFVTAETEALVEYMKSKGRRE